MGLLNGATFSCMAWRGSAPAHIQAAIFFLLSGPVWQREAALIIWPLIVSIRT